MKALRIGARALPVLSALSLLVTAGCQSSRPLGPLWYERYAHQPVVVPATAAVQPLDETEGTPALSMTPMEATASVGTEMQAPATMTPQNRASQALARAPRTKQAAAASAPLAATATAQTQAPAETSAPLTQRQQSRFQRQLDRVAAMLPAQALSPQKSQAVGKILNTILIIVGAVIVITLLIILVAAL